MSETNTENLLIYNTRKQSSGTIWLLFLFLGWSYGSLGSMVKQIFYYLTFGGFGIWAGLGGPKLSLAMRSATSCLILRASL